MCLHALLVCVCVCVASFTKLLEKVCKPNSPAEMKNLCLSVFGSCSVVVMHCEINKVAIVFNLISTVLVATALQHHK